ncbi:MAG TPA: OmpA family protein [Burkholderiaceae bacterium]
MKSSSMGATLARSILLSLLACLMAACTIAPIAPSATPFEQDVSTAVDHLSSQWLATQPRPAWLVRIFPNSLALGHFADLPAAGLKTSSGFAQPESIATAKARQIAARRLEARHEFRQIAANQAPDLLLSASLSADKVLTLVLEDRQEHRIVARWQGPVRVDAADLFPGRYSNDSPVIFMLPKAVSDTALFGRPDSMPLPEQDYAMRAQLALLEDARSAYDSGDYEMALQLFKNAAAQPSALAMRAYNGQYLSYRALGREALANAAFKRVIEEGLKTRTLAIKLLFMPGQTSFWSDPAISGSYGFWIQELSAQAAASTRCLEVAGHTSHTGTEDFNLGLSLARSKVVAGMLQADQPGLAHRLSAVGMGWSQNIVGSGTDDARDAIDRRVEFKISDCPPAAPAAPTTPAN